MIKYSYSGNYVLPPNNTICTICTLYSVYGKGKQMFDKRNAGAGVLFRQNLIIFPYCVYYVSVTGKGKDIYYINTINIKLH